MSDLTVFLERWDHDIVTRRLWALYYELTDPSPMKIRITEETFWMGAARRAGDVLDNQVAGPFRNELGADGKQHRRAQFVEMAEEIRQSPVAVPLSMPSAAVGPVAVTAEPAKAAATVPPPASFAEATAAILKPPSAAGSKPAGNPLAARVRALTARRAKFQDVAAAVLDQGEQAMTTIETDGPAILERAVAASHDELAAIHDLGSSLKELDRSNS